LAEKAGMTVEKMRPLTEAVLRQYIFRAWAGAGIAGMCCFVCLGLTVWGLWKLHTYKRNVGLPAVERLQMLCVVAGMGMAGLLLAVIIHMFHALAPLPSMLGL